PRERLGQLARGRLLAGHDHSRRSGSCILSSHTRAAALAGSPDARRPYSGAVAVRLVCFDIGETLVDETEVWGSWADSLAISRLTFFAALGAVIERGGHHLEVFGMLRPGFDVTAALEAAALDDEGRGQVGVSE